MHDILYDRLLSALIDPDNSFVAEDDVLETLKFTAINPSGRHQAWNYLRTHWNYFYIYYVY